jgi:hypothetical protein
VYEDKSYSQQTAEAVAAVIHDHFNDLSAI